MVVAIVFYIQKIENQTVASLPPFSPDPVQDDSI